MPMLPAEASVHPLNLFEAEETRAADDRAWWVLHTKPRQEKALARHLVGAGVPFYLPLLTRKTMIRGRPMPSYLPLFTSYLFLFGDERERISALSTNRVVRSIEVTDQRALWGDLSHVHRLILSGMPVAPEDRLYPGVPVEICHGPLSGLKGVIVREAGCNRFIVKVDFIQKGASVTLDDFALAAISE